MLVGRIIVVNLASEDFSGEKMTLSLVPSSNWAFKPFSLVLL